MEEKPRVILLGKTGAGKSSFCNTLIREPEFEVDFSSSSCTSTCQTKENDQIILIDTPGFFDTGTEKNKNLKSQAIKIMIECSPGPHAFLILLKVEKYTEQEIQVIAKIKELFSEEAFKHAVLVFTQGDQLPQPKKIEHFVKGNKDLEQLLEKCGGRCHVVDNKYWNNNQPDCYRDNQFQIRQLLYTIKMVKQHRGCYTNELLKEVERNIQEETKRTRSKEEAKKIVFEKFQKKAAKLSTRELLAAFLGQPKKVALVLGIAFVVVALVAPAVGVPVGLAAGVGAGIAAGAAAGVGAGVAAGAVVSGVASEAGATIRGHVAEARGRAAGYEHVKTDSDEEVEANRAEMMCEQSNTQRKTKAE
ncbi:GTPase IMAP family member 9-like isoform X2 [Salarias fasciatus]|uniref:GTPase IMAP family member 9-like isoform X2 n=1 Tax=Salarias fasciatus TaxID=181472 RepID=UPI001176C5FE|nr:GTPase IMAP family member 9-like isoform X2 [Salarias fasciatus]